MINNFKYTRYDLRPLVSIIVPIFNSELTLAKCIDSVLNQVYTNFELILVNDGSQDNSLQICREYELKDNRVKVVNQSNSGVSRARNRGIEISVGDFICFIDSDDNVEPDYYEYLVNELISSGADALALSKYTIKRSKITDSQIDATEAMKRILLLELPTSVWAYIYKAESIKEIRFSEEIHFFEDLLFNFEIFETIEKIKLYDYDGYHYSHNPNSANGSPLSEKKMSCLMIPKKMDVKDVENEMVFFEAHCLISLILSMSKDKDSLPKYATKISKECRRFISKMNRKVPFQYRILIIMTAYFPTSISNILRILKGR